MGTRAVSRRHDNGGEKALFYLIITLQYVELIACILEIAGSIYLAVRGPGDSVAVIASIAMLIASSTSLCVLVVHQLAAKSLQGQSLREYRRRQHSLRGIMGSFLILLLIAWTTTGVFSIVEATRSTGCHDSGDASRYWRAMINCVVQKATLAIALLMIIVTLALLAAIFTLENAFAASLSGLHRRSHTEEEGLYLSNHPTYANVTVTPYREKRIKAPLFDDTTPNFDPVYPNDSPTSIDTSSPTPRPLDRVMTSPSRGPGEEVKNAHSRQRSWLPPLKFHEHTVTLHPALQSTSAVNLLPPSMKPGGPISTTSPQPNPAAESMPDLLTPHRKSHTSKPQFRPAGLARTKTAATMASSVYSRHTNTTMTCTAHSDEDDKTNSLFSRQPSLSSLSMSSHGSPYSTMKTPPTKSFIRHPATTNPFAPWPSTNPPIQTPTTTTTASAPTDPPKKPRPLPIIGGTTNPFLDCPPTTTTPPQNTNPIHSQSPNNDAAPPPPPPRPRSSPSMPPSPFWLYARRIQRSANSHAQDGAFPVFPTPKKSPSPRRDSPGGRRRSNTAPSCAVAAPPPKFPALLQVSEVGVNDRSTHPAFRAGAQTKLEGGGGGGGGGNGNGNGVAVTWRGGGGGGERSRYERVRKSALGGMLGGFEGLVGDGEGMGRSRSSGKLLSKKKKGDKWGRIGRV